MPTQSGLKIGYALGGGGARGVAHIGVLKVLEERGIYPDVIVGTSFGALIGAVYASGLKAADLEKVALRMRWTRLALLADVAVSAGGLLYGRRVVGLLRSLIGDLAFTDLKIPFACIATDITYGQEVVMDSGSVVEAVRASLSVPGVLAPVRLGKRYLVDGGVVDPVPVRPCRKLGARYVIGVNVIPDPSRMALKPRKGRASAAPVSPVSAKPPVSASVDSKAPGLFQVLSQSLLISSYHMAMESLKDADLTISPALYRMGLWQFDRAAEAIAAGEEAAREALQQARDLPL